MIMSTLPKNPKSDIRAHKPGCTAVRFWVFFGGGHGCSTDGGGVARFFLGGGTEILIPFSPADFQRVEKPKGVPLEIGFFC